LLITSKYQLDPTQTLLVRYWVGDGYVAVAFVIIEGREFSASSGDGAEELDVRRKHRE
jgi:hypothetical protein